MALSVRPGSIFAISAHWLPSDLWYWKMMKSSSGCHASFFTSGLRWLCQLRAPARGAARPARERERKVGDEVADHLVHAGREAAGRALVVGGRLERLEHVEQRAAGRSYRPAAHKQRGVQKQRVRRRSTAASRGERREAAVELELGEAWP